MLASNAPAIVTTNFPGRQRGQALGIQSTMTYLGLMLGPSVGGYLTSLFGWRSVFFINLPIGLLALLLSIIAIPQGHERNVRERFDLLGAGVFMMGLVTLLLGLNRGKEWGWSSPLTLGVLAGALAVLGLFIWIERTVRDPMLKLGLFKTRLFSAATAAAVFNYICLYGIFFLMPFYLRQGRGFTPDSAGLILSVQPLVMAIMAPLAGTLSDRIGSHFLTTAGMILLAVALALISTIGATTPMVWVVLYFGLVGFGVGVFVSPNSNALMGSAPRSSQGVAAGVMATARNTGMVLGVGLASAAFVSAEAHAQALGRPDAFFRGIHVTFQLLAGVACLGAITSSVRGNTYPDEA